MNKNIMFMLLFPAFGITTLTKKLKTNIQLTIV